MSKMKKLCMKRLKMKKRAKYERDKFIDSLEFANIEDFFSISN